MNQELKSASESRAQSLLKPTDSSLWQFIRFGIVGGVATVADYAVLISFTVVLHQSEFRAVAAGYAVGLMVSYVLSIIWVFSNRSVSDKRVEFAIFMLLGLIGWVLTEVCVIASHNGLNMIPSLVSHSTDTLRLSIAKAIAVVVVFFFNFWSRKVLLFKNRPS